ncbi:MAG: hypothetical protein OEM24_12215 [Paracoccaceae bacterium]|nr:hypothetical protein [Paracoccaceae bacterium]
MSAFARLWRDHRLVLLAFAAALAVTLFFAVRTAVFWVYWSDPARRDRAIEGWMTPGYVAQSWQVDREVVSAALGLEPGVARGRTLREIAAAQGVPLAELEAALMAAIAGARAGE